ncbi:hypothetical protein LU293_09600 [Moraxella nasovis]|uniref:DarT1-associated NADAR antitoxin family protein n=1 Tax=Moraxella nasovis TaxID=2904121 RepID=UPI001F604278|nr:hypothetical protein [Moraxella nasovis]UNU73301.1 hypothetical protein LU293_09600 [Moraxella nasovis]
MFYGSKWELNPTTAFYDWLYINALNQNKQYHHELLSYQAFTDIEFNPEKSINCQAYSVAMFVALAKNDMLGVLKDKEAFLGLYQKYKIDNTTKYHKELKQTSLL